MKFFVSFTLAILLSACASPKAPDATQEDWQQASQLTQTKHQRTQGSLYSSHYMFTLYEDKRAYRVGDILTVELDERTQSSKSSDANIDKETKIAAAAPLINIPKIWHGDSSKWGLDLKSNSEFSGGSSANQQNYLRGAITVRVTEVLPNGALAIQGEKRIRLNQGDEYIRLKGLVRPEDIDVTNRVSSQRVANATISYSGKGAQADASRPGWLTYLFNLLNPL